MSHPDTPNRHDLIALDFYLSKDNATREAFRPDFFTVGRSWRSHYTFPRYSWIIERESFEAGRVPMTKKEASACRAFFRKNPRCKRCVLLDVKALRKYARTHETKTAAELRELFEMFAKKPEKVAKLS